MVDFTTLHPFDLDRNLFNFLVITEPSVVDLLPMISAMSREDLIVECNITGKPSPQASWSKDGVTLNQSSRVQISTVNIADNNYRSTLSVQSATSADSGIYTCTGSNVLPYGTITSSLSTTVNIIESK